jgi:hypothetical protein
VQLSTERPLLHILSKTDWTVKLRGFPESCKVLFQAWWSRNGIYFSVRTNFKKPTPLMFPFLVELVIFGSVRFLSKNSNQTDFKKKTETGSNRPVLVRFGFLGQNRFKPFWLGFFGFRLIKPKPNRTGRFFQNFNRFNRFFFTVRFFSYFFLFSLFNRFFNFFTYPLIFRNAD